MGYVKIGTAHTFNKVDATKPFALKIAEETCEVYSAFENYRDAASTMRAKERKKLLLEIADTITACGNLAQALGCTDLTTYMAMVEESNRRKGRL